MFDWKPCKSPELPTTKGRFIELSALQIDEDIQGLFHALCGEDNDDLWSHLPVGPFETLDEFRYFLSSYAASHGWDTIVFRTSSDRRIVGMSSYMRIRPDAGSIEVGAVVYSKEFQTTSGATEAMFIMARYVFDELGYRRYEWKCDNQNTRSKNAACRLGFTFEGIFRQDMVMKGRNRDTAWFSLLDEEWPQAKAAFEAWLQADNHDEDGRQRCSLASLRTRGACPP